MRKETSGIQINEQYYSGTDSYTDGDIEEELLDFVKNHHDYTQLLSKDSRWPILYHLSPLRRNLLEWYDFKSKSSLLEIGAGCGALTGLFSEKVEKVTAIELSKRRAEIIANRYKNHYNIEIVLGNFIDVDLAERFDYITLIGVLEYAGKFIDSDNPGLRLLNHTKKYLKPDGILMIAIENKFGLKYWAGAGEDHTGKLFDGIEGYISSDGVVTYSKDELMELLSYAGFQDVFFYYPFPDYKLPTQIFSDLYMPKVGQIGDYFPNYDQQRIRVFDEKLVFENLIRSKKFSFFSNSFLVICKTRG